MPLKKFGGRVSLRQGLDEEVTLRPLMSGEMPN